ncbi:MAG: substrate-binding domain-containing protein [Anaerolineae bacterium]|nr:substrate-binding domain-containing protein [Anaerolineae bacterium]
MKQLIIVLELLSIVICLVACDERNISILNEVPTPVSVLDPDNEPNALSYVQLEAQLGPISRASRPYHIGVVLKFLGNQYWQFLAEGVQTRANELGVTVDIRAAETENDPEGQYAIMLEILDGGYDAFIIAPQTDTNLTSGVATARDRGLPVLVVDEVIKDAHYWVGVECH